MIESISISKVSSYPTANPETFDRLSKFNYVYGANGSGKTTVSRLLGSTVPAEGCGVAWKNGNPLETLVYKRDFVEANFGALSALKGIFTLGEENVENSKAIDVLRADIHTLEQRQIAARNSLFGGNGTPGVHKNKADCEARLQEKCWSMKAKYERFRPAFDGHIASKAKITAKILTEAELKPLDTPEIEDLDTRAGTIFGPSPTAENTIQLVDVSPILSLESDPILETVVVGKEDVDIAALIERLSNSDWVRQGMEYLTVDEKICPFCQQSVPDALSESLSEYFDDEFLKNTEQIKKVRADYRGMLAEYETWLGNIIAAPSRFLDFGAVEDQFALFKAVTSANLILLEQKEKEPSRKVELEAVGEICETIDAHIAKANADILTHNDLVANFAREKRELTADVWKYLVNAELNADLETYHKEMEGISKGMAALEKQIADAEAEIIAKRKEIRKLERATTSVKPTMDAINGLLASFGFDGFALALADDKNGYKLVRADGSDAKETLSEGERSFITFLYFYYRVKGGDSESGVTSDRVVVFDDPVSSLDSEVLFIVGSLIKDLLEDVRNNGSIKQIFVFTHNVYFHKEVTYNSRRKKTAMNEESFWIIRKSAGVSRVERHESNPIKSSYELLWGELKREGTSPVTIQNTMRRILEQYFRVMGSADITEITKEFTGKDKVICGSLFSWLHDGSHLAHDDLYIAIDDAMALRYREVFKDIFTKTNQSGHYDMMMGLTANTADATA